MYNLSKQKSCKGHGKYCGRFTMGPWIGTSYGRIWLWLMIHDIETNIKMIEVYLAGRIKTKI
jgi:hypothetical protein